MKLMLYLLRASWRTALLAAVIGGVSGAASVGMVAVVLKGVENPQASTARVVALFAALCVVVLATRILSQILVALLTRSSVLEMQMGLCRRILASPVKHLEEIGSPRMLAALTSDVATVSHAMSGVPSLGVNIVILLCGAIYLGTLSLPLLGAAAVFCGLGMFSYWYSANFAARYVERAREEQNVLHQRIHELIHGVKELKMNHARRHEFVEQVLHSAETTAHRSQMIADGLFNAAVGWGRLTFFVAIGLLLFLWPRYSHDNPATLNGYVLVILYLMSPVEQIMAWLPYMNWAMESVRQIENLGLLLDQCAPEAPATAPVARWQQIEFVDVTHAYRREGRPHGFVLGPFQLTLSPGEIIFVIGGNGSGKTTLAKLITGLYVPETGRVRLDGRSIVSENREGYRQLFSAVFDDAMVFDNLWGIAAEGRDQTAHEHLRRLQLDHLVSVSNGAFSTTALSRGQRKRLALLTAYLEDRLIYVFDEWAADQDPVFRKFFYLNLLPELKARGKTVVAITHDDRYFGTADRVIKLDEGKVVEIMRHESIEEYQCEIV